MKTKNLTPHEDNDDIVNMSIFDLPENTVTSDQTDLDSQNNSSDEQSQEPEDEEESTDSDDEVNEPKETEDDESESESVKVLEFKHNLVPDNSYIIDMFMKNDGSYGKSESEQKITSSDINSNLLEEITNKELIKLVKDWQFVSIQGWNKTLSNYSEKDRQKIINKIGNKNPIGLRNYLIFKSQQLVKNSKIMM
jgi:hypothetical protein